LKKSMISTSQIDNISIRLIKKKKMASLEISWEWSRETDQDDPVYARKLVRLDG